jgi:hypothetical protein
MAPAVSSVTRLAVADLSGRILDRLSKGELGMPPLALTLRRLAPSVPLSTVRGKIFNV